MVEQERRRVDQRPSEVLGTGEAAVGELVFGLFGVLTEADEFGVEGDRNLGGGDDGAALG